MASAFDAPRDGVARALAAPPPVAAVLDHPLTLLFARVCVTAPFLAAGVTKLLFWQAGEGEMLHVGLHPAWVFNLAALLTELGGSLLIIGNRGVWLGAGALGVFTVLTTFLAHRFWELSGDAYGRELNTFLEHVTIAAAFILVAVLNLRRPRNGLS